MMDKLCLTKFIKLIFDGPKQRLPLVDLMDPKLFSILTSDPEKLFQEDFSIINFLTTDLGKQVKFPNLILFPVKKYVKNLWTT